MNTKKKWTTEQLREAVQTSKSMRQVLKKLGLVEAGGNYVQIKKYIAKLGLEVSHFTGRSWNKGLRGLYRVHTIPLEKLLVNGSYIQSFKLKKRLLNQKIKKMACELCGWNKKAVDGRIPLELDHINGNRNDNRLENLRVLCPNCHSLQPTHRGLNKKRK